MEGGEEVGRHLGCVDSCLWKAKPQGRLLFFDFNFLRPEAFLPVNSALSCDVDPKGRIPKETLEMAKKYLHNFTTYLPYASAFVSPRTFFSNSLSTSS